MPRVNIRRKNRAGKEITCGNCGDKIEPGQQYRSWKFRYGGARFRCMKPECAPTPGDLTQSKMGAVYDAQAEVEKVDDNDLAGLADALDALVETIREVGGEYAEAAEHFGNSGENQERADALEQWADEIDQHIEPIRDAADAIENGKSAAGECPV